MDTPTRPGPQAPVFVDEVDRVVEFADGGATAPEAAAANGRSPVLTDVVDRLVEFADTPAGPFGGDKDSEPRLTFIDSVDRVVEFTDEPAASPVSADPEPHAGEDRPIRQTIGGDEPGPAQPH